ncbi:UNVERIFIED_ORG: hypothetical protein M2435_006919 [Rhizobium sophorae]|uniref:hypothetical protein n=1 Tax=Rhizobium leguminosarum TaxID=384 RepID=UPI00160ABE89|nr:hypothetical protein [Rhizobium leguminosarum]MBB4526843.1 hypothetical protein [Rhizobium leguminosarum]MDH6663972.1 hypothetical protein [Rhizobium sophorae]
MQSRRSIAERTIARTRERGMPIDGDVEYMTLVELWIEGEIDIQAMRQRYNELLAHRSADRKARRDKSSFSQSFKPVPVSNNAADASIDLPSIDEVETAGVFDDAADRPPRDEASPTG